MEENLKEKWMDESSIFLRDIYAFCKQFIDEFNLNNKDNDLSKNAVTNYLVEWVKLLDSVGILFYEGRVDTAQILTRSMFEIQLQLCYLIKESDELEEKAAFIYVVSNLKRYWFNKNRIENQVKQQQKKKRIQKKQAERTAYEEYVQNKRLSAQDARTRLVAESSSSAKTVTISQAVASYEANFTMAVSVSNKTQ